MDTFLWWRDGVIYQIYPRSFFDTNADGIGDIKGILSKLDYLADLGIDAIWLSPVYPSPDVDFGYDVSDYRDIDPRYGRMRDFDELLRQAHKRGIRIIMDLVLNHTSEQHPWFQDALRSRDSRYRDYYLWRDPAEDGKPPNNWLAMVGGSGWEYHAETGQYYFHHYFKEQPDLNWRNPEVRKVMLDVFKFWLEKGVDGFRLDVFSAYFKHADFPDNPKKLWGLRPHDRLRHIYDMDQPEMLPLIREIRALLEKYPERYVVGETFMATYERAAMYCGDDLLHAAFSFREFLEGKWRAKKFLRAIKRWEELLDNKAWPNYVLNNHDVVRSATRFKSDANDARMKVAAAMLLTLRGTPFLYYGEEIGMREMKFLKDEILDPVGRYYYPLYKGRDGCRTPMQWDDSPFAGFSTAEPWLAVNPDHKQRNVKAQAEDENSLLNFYRALLKLRKEHIVLMRGDFEAATHMPPNTLVYFRCTQEEQMLIALNFDRKKKRVDLERIGALGCDLIFSTHHERGEMNQCKEFWLEGNEVAIFRLKSIDD